ncbi:MAG: autotransporter domain-containing protein, partial [Polynucleobacter sp.]
SALSGSAIQVGSGTLAGTISGSINNSGQIIGALSGIQVANNGVIIGQISNSGTITGTNAFNLANTASPFVINNTGVINGNVILGNNTLNLNGLSNIVNGSISGGTSSAVNLSGSLASSGDIDVGSFNIQSGGNLTLANPITVSGTGRLLSNAGTLTIAAGVTQTLTGNYSQSGTYALGVNSPISYGILNVSGNTSFSGGYGFTLLPSSTLVANNLYQGILRSGAISGFSNQTYTQTLGGTSYRYSILQNATNAGWLDLCYGNCFPASTADTQQSIVNTASALQPIYTLQNTVLTNSFSYDCALFGANGVCVSAGGRNTALQAANGLNNTSGLLIASYRVDKNNSRIGAYADQNLSVKNAGSTVTLGNSTPLVGLFGVWSQHPDGIGAEVKVSAAYGQKNTTITRQVVGDSEPGSGSSTLNSQGAQLTAKYGFGVTENTMVSPYLGMRYTQNNMGGYTEGASSTVTAPLTYSALNTNATTALAGLGARHLLNAKTILFASAGVESDTNTSNGTYYATGITGLTPVNFNANPVKTRPTASIGATYLVEKNQQIGLSGIYRQEPYQGVSTTSVFLTYTIGL